MCVTYNKFDNVSSVNIFFSLFGLFSLSLISFYWSVFHRLSFPDMSSIYKTTLLCKGLHNSPLPPTVLGGGFRYSFSALPVLKLRIFVQKKAHFSSVNVW